MRIGASDGSDVKDEHSADFVQVWFKCVEAKNSGAQVRQGTMRFAGLEGRFRGDGDFERNFYFVVVRNQGGSGPLYRVVFVVGGWRPEGLLYRSLAFPTGISKVKTRLVPTLLC